MRYRVDTICMLWCMFVQGLTINLFSIVPIIIYLCASLNNACVCERTGGALVDIGESMKRMAEVKDSLDIDVKQNFLDPLQAVAEKDIKDIQVESNIWYASCTGQAVNNKLCSLQ